MSQTKITIVGKLRFSDEKGLEYSISVGKPEKTIWMWTGPQNAHDWPGLGKYPEYPEEKPAPSALHNRAAYQQWAAAKKQAEEDWKSAANGYSEKLNADPTYRRAQFEVLELQRREPQLCPKFFALVPDRIQIWFYRDLVLSLESKEPESLRETSADGLAIKHHVLRRERNFERMRREVEALENMEKLEGVSREPIPESVRLFVWQRDKGQCVKCSSRERLEFDHIIPITAGGSNTDRNIQLLCEPCNRSKGATI